MVVIALSVADIGLMCAKGMVVAIKLDIHTSLQN